MAEFFRLGSLKNSAVFNLQDDFFFHLKAGPCYLCRFYFVHVM